MKNLFCPVKGRVMPANIALKTGEYRCTGCGNTHSSTATPVFFSSDLSSSSKRKKFKKGGKSKGKKKGEKK